MAYFQNVFDTEFLDMLQLADRQYNSTYRMRANKNSSVQMRVWGAAPYNTVGNTTLTMNVSINGGVSYMTMPIAITSGVAVMPSQIVADLNADSHFASFFVATVEGFSQDQKGLVMVKARYPRENFKAYIDNTSAESVLRFNKQCSILQMPAYFARHTIANRLTFTDSFACLVQLTQPTDDTIISEAGLSTTPSSDYALLAGRSGAFTFSKQTVDTSSRVTSRIEYAAGAAVGDLARKTTYSYTGTQTEPDIIAEVPYVLVLADLITPP